jgi:hypothetical protein
VTPPGGVVPTGFTDTGAVNGTTYYYVVRAVIAGAESTNSRVVEATPAAKSCSTGNPVVVENCFPGTNQWNVGTAVSLAAGGIEGFATAVSVNRGSSVDVKLQTSAAATARLEIYRSGWYGGMGGRLISAIRGLSAGPQAGCSSDGTTGLYFCTSWSIAATVTTTATWPSGVYLIRLVREDNGADYEFPVVVRNDASTAGLLYGVPFTTYQAYNNAGGRSLYSYNSTGAATVSGTSRAVKVSFDRPWNQPRDTANPNWYGHADYPMVSWLERSGYDISYQADLDLEANPNSPRTHQAYVAGAHDEYWSSAMRTALEGARGAGVDLFFSGSNTVYWQIRFENGTRTEVCYKTTEGGAEDPVLKTRLWRDPNGANKPENALIGQMYAGDKDGVYFPLVVSAAEGTDRIWRYSGLENQAPGTSTSVGTQLVGWEWDHRDTGNGAEPTGVKTLATSPVTGNILAGPTGGYNQGSTISNITKYTAASGALVFATGTNHWGRGLNLTADGSGGPDRRIQQATTNVFADMGVQPSTPAANITLDSATAPRVSSTVPGDGETGVATTAVVKASFSRAMDPATITTASFTLKRPDGTTVPATIAYDGATSSATLTPSAALAFSTQYTARLDTTVKAADGTPLQSAFVWVFTTRSNLNPVRLNSGGAAVTTGDGRVFAADANFTGGTTLSVTSAIAGTTDDALYQNERWGNFSYAIPVTNGTYDVKLHFVELYYTTGSCVGKRVFSFDIADTATSPDVANLDVCAAAGGANTALVRTVYSVQVSDGFLNLQSVYGAADDPELAAVEVVPSSGPPPAPTVTATTPAAGATGVAATIKPTATFSRAMDPTTITPSTFTLTPAGGSPVAATVAYDSSTNVATLTPSAALSVSTTYTATIAATVKAADSTPLGTPFTWSFTTSAAPPTGGTTVRINAGGGAYTSSTGDTFTADASFTGGSTFTSTGTISGTADPNLYKDERWGSFSYAIPVTNGTYDVKLHFVELFYTTGSCIGKRVFSIDIGDTTGTDVSNLDICAAAGGANTALVRTVSGVAVTDGVLNLQSVYGSADDPEIAAIEVIPSGPAPPPGPPTVSAKTPAAGATNVPATTTVTATFSRAMDATTITTSTFTLKNGAGTSVTATVAYNSSTLTATLTPSAALAFSTTYTAALSTGVKAADGQALASAVSWTFTTASSAPPPGSTVRVNSGGSAYTSPSGAVFSADQYFTGGGTFSTTAAIANTSDPSLYQDERWGNFSYAIPVTNGTYDVRLHFVEMFFTTGSCIGKRVFSIDIGDTAGTDVANLDVCSEAGGANRALVKTVTGVSVTDGTLNLQSVYGSADDPELAAIEVEPSGSAPPPPPDPAVVGQWGSVLSWPLVTVHASLLPTGNVLVFDGFADAPNSQRVWNPATNTFVAVPYGVNIFCAGHVNLPDGRVFIAGGHVSADVGLPATTIFDPATSTWTAAPDMTVARWYPTATQLPNGKVLVFSGDNIVQNRPGATPPFSDASVNSLPEVFDPVTNTWQDLTGARLTSPLYPFMFVLSDGRILDAGPDTQSRILDPATWTWSNLAVSSFDGMSAVMYRPNKIMKSGSWADPDFNGSQAYTTIANTAVLDMSAPTPAWRNTTAMNFPRAYHNLTLLPDGTVLASGGLTTSDGIDLSKAVLPAEIWDPTTEKWTTVASEQIGRGYHATALLLPDGRVLMAGGGQLPGSAAINNTNAEIYSPPYLFKGARPTIASAPSLLQYNQGFTVSTPNAASIASVSLIRTPSVTHAFDENQRFVPLSFTAGSGQLTVSAPANSNLAPPGYYMLFIVNSTGVPSVASFVRFPAPWEDTVAPTAPTLSASGGIGLVNLAWSASTDNVGVTRYSVYRSTTPGFTPGSANRIAFTTVGVPNYVDRDVVAGTTYYYRVKAEDAAGNLSPSSNEASATATADSAAPTVSVTAPAGGATVTGTVSVTANASDDVGVVGVQFQLDGANLGIEDPSSPWAVSWDTTTASNASHTLTAIARDAAGHSTTSAQVTVTVSNTAPPPPPPPTGLVASYNFDAGTGTTVADLSGNANAGTITGANWATAGKNGGALSFNGTSNYVQVADSNSLDLTTGMTLEAWVNPAALGTAWRTVLFKEQSGGMIYSLYANQDTTRPVGQVNIGGEQNVVGAASLALNTWSHLAVTYDGSALRLYVNGAVVATTPATGTIPASTGVLRMGGNSVWGEWFGGLLDDVRIYSRALSAGEIATDMGRPVS